MDSKSQPDHHATNVEVQSELSALEDGHDALAATYRKMFTIRRVEEVVGQFFALGLIEDPVKLCIGREALAVGAVDARKPDDHLVVGTRRHGYMLASGLPGETLLEELVAGGSAWQKTQSNHLVASAGGRGGIWAYDGSEAGLLARALSLALLVKNQTDQSAVLAILDGDRSDTESLTRLIQSSQRWRLPLVMVVDHATPAPVPGSLSVHPLESHPDLAFKYVDGINVAAVTVRLEEALARARQNQSPQGLVVSTQAFRGHNNDAAPQSRKGKGGALLQTVKKTLARGWSDQPQRSNDPLERTRHVLISGAPDGASLVKQIEDDARQYVQGIRQTVRNRALGA